MTVKLLHTGPLQVNTYVLWEDGRDDCVVVDPGGAEEVLDFLSAKRLRCTHILLTHGHFDHVGGAAQLKEATGAQVYISAEDGAALSGDTPANRMMGVRVRPCAYESIADGEDIEAAGLRFRVIATPGHTKGGVCFVLEAPQKTILSGDTLFRANVGRCDLPGGSPQALYDAIKDKLFTLEGDYAVLPGHDRETTLNYEREHNPYLTKYGPEQW